MASISSNIFSRAASMLNGIWFPFKYFQKLFTLNDAISSSSSARHKYVNTEKAGTEKLRFNLLNGNGFIPPAGFLLTPFIPINSVTFSPYALFSF